MTNEDIFDMANEAKKTAHNPSEWAFTFARLIERATREECASLCDERMGLHNSVAAAIRGMK